MPKPIEFNWTTQDRIRKYEDYLRGSRPVVATSLAATLNWATAESPTPTPDEEVPDVLAPDVKFPDTLVDDPKDSDDAVDHSDGTKSHDTSAALSFATNWDALLDTAGVPTDGTPPDPLAAQQQQEQLKEQAARQAQMLGKDIDGTQPGITAPQMPATPATPQAQDKANQRQRAGRGVEGRTCPSGSPMPATGCGACTVSDCVGRIVAAKTCPKGSPMISAEGCGDCDCEDKGAMPGMPVASRTCPSGSPMPAEGCGACTVSDCAERSAEARTRPSGSPMPAEGCGDCNDCDEGPTNPMDPENRFDWDSFSTTPRI